MLSARQSARAPTKRSRADGDVDEREVGSRPHVDPQRGLAAQRASPPRPVATGRRRGRRPSPRASPGTRCWCRSRARTIGMSPHALATTRCVPSPPSTTIARDARVEHRSTARRACRCAVPSAACRAPRAPGAARRRAPCGSAAGGAASAESPSAAGIISARSTPAAPRPASSAEDHPGLLGVAEHRRARDEPADVPPGGRVGDDPHGDVSDTRRSPYDVAAGCAGVHRA